MIKDTETKHGSDSLKVRVWAFFVILSYAGAANARDESPAFWYDEGQKELLSRLSLHTNTGRAENVILFLGDGMGISTVTAARIFEGQLRGGQGEENLLSFESLPYTGLAKTYNTNQQTPDSAGTMTAIVTGVKTRAGLISVSQLSERANCMTRQGNELKTLLEEMEELGYATGLVTTARVTHATPAATYAHISERDWENDSAMPAEVVSRGCRDIAAQLLDFPHGNGIEVMLGGGREHFLGNLQADPEYPDHRGRRRDGRDLTKRWKEKYPGGEYVWNLAQFNKVNPANTSHLLGLFEPSHMRFETDRTRDGAGEPSLTEMTEKALRFLEKNEKGYFLMVEGGRIDHGHHFGNAYRALHETKAFSDAIDKTLQRVDPDKTLIIVTADHSHVFTIGGYPTRGNPILGKVVNNDSSGRAKSRPELAEDGKPYTTLGYYNGDGFAVLDDIGLRDDGHDYGESGRMDITHHDTTQSNYYQESLIPLVSETHGGEDVAIYAGGPWAHLFQGVHEQNYIYHVIRHALQLDKQAETQQ